LSKNQLENIDNICKSLFDLQNAKKINLNMDYNKIQNINYSSKKEY